jgi:2-haloacid dehalogenase
MLDPTVIVFDVNETLSDMAPMGARFTEVGVPESASTLWFATLLRDGFALAAAGSMATFRSLAEGALRRVLMGSSLRCDMDSAVERILAGFMDLDVHPDVPDGIIALQRRGKRLVTLTNGSTNVADRLLSRAGVRDRFERLLSVDAAGAWKPAAVAYRYAAQECGVMVQEMLLVSVHPWDIDGAARAGLQTAWLNRADEPYPGYFTSADHTFRALTDLAVE